MQEKHWKLLNQPSAEELTEYQQELKVPPLVAMLMMSRKIKTVEDANAFFNPLIQHCHDPFLMDEMDLAVKRIQQAKEQDQRIRIYGDYDVDGTTSVSVVYDFLKSRFKNIDYYIPDRDSEGYGISEHSIDDAIDKKVELVIALDCGVRSVELIAKAKKEGIDFIVCDHHLPGPELPPTVAMLNPKKGNCTYPFKELSGCGIGWKLVQALCVFWDLPDEAYLQYLDKVAVSIASDLVELTGENRVLAAAGIQRLENRPSRGLQMIVDRFIRNQNKDARLDIMKIVFMIGPRINAAGRLGDAKVAVRLLLAENEEEAESLAGQLNELNKERRGLDSHTTKEALEILKRDKDYPTKYSTVVAKDDWHKGVVGIVASRLLEQHYKPTIVLTKSGDQLVGSARSIMGFDIHEALVNCKEHLLQFGGHKYAAGMRLKASQFEPFEKTFDNYAKSLLKPDDLVPVLQYDAEIGLNLISDKFHSILQRFAPFGPGNLQPLFMSSEVWDTGNARTMGSGHEHLRMNLISVECNRPISAIAFNMGSFFDPVSKGKPFSILYHIEQNHFNGKTSLQLLIQDIKFR